MRRNHLLAIFCWLLLVVLGGVKHDGETALLLGLASFVPFSMIVFSGFWADWILPLGWMEQFAKDRSHPEHSAPALVLLGWLLLLALLAGWVWA
jgi:hypothetical protein